MLLVLVYLCNVRVVTIRDKLVYHLWLNVLFLIVQVRQFPALTLYLLGLFFEVGDCLLLRELLLETQVVQNYGAWEVFCLLFSFRKDSDGGGASRDSRVESV